MKRRTGPIQQWVDSIPSPTRSNITVPSGQQKHIIDGPNISITRTEPKDILLPTKSNISSMTVSAPINVSNSPIINTTRIPSSVPYNRLTRDPSLQSDSSHCSSVESLLELRKADPEAILLSLGFGGPSSSGPENGPLSRIPKRFLQPSKLKGISLNDFLKRQQETSESFDSVSLGYRGLTGSPYVAPSEIVQKIMERLREHESHELENNLMHNCYDQYNNQMQQNSTFSVLSLDNRQYLERPRSKSPDMRNKRMIIGQKSFAFGHDGDLIEISSADKKVLDDSSSNNGISVDEFNAHIDLKSVNLEKNDTKSEKVSYKNVEKKLTKQFSFSSSMEFPDFTKDEETTMEETTNYSEMFLNQNKVRSTCEIINLNIDKDKKPTTHNSEDEPIILKHLSSNLRRASDSFCETKENTLMKEGRRFSDGIMHAIEDQNNPGLLLLRKRKSFKRQPKISDTDEVHYCDYTNSFDSTVSDDKQSNFSSASDEVGILTDDKTTHRSRLSAAIENHNANMEKDEATYNNVDSDMASCSPEVKYSQEELNSLESEENLMENYKCDGTCTDCCCHTDNAKCWEKMEKIMKENRKLKDMVTKNRREMAQIRDMLKSVLSVRMEPGF